MSIHVHELGLQPYLPIWEKMQAFTQARTSETPDQLWLLEHEPVYTQGQAGRPEHLLMPNPNIPVIQSDRGGQITYHGPGQLMVYCLLDLKRLKIGIRTLVCQLEQTLIALLHSHQIDAHTQCGAPGVYVNHQKIASIGLRVKKNCTYHGIALNINMDLKPFQAIHPCGFEGLKMTHMQHYHPQITVREVAAKFPTHFSAQFEK